MMVIIGYDQNLTSHKQADSLYKTKLKEDGVNPLVSAAG